MSKSEIRGILVEFPFEPYELQKDYMSKVIECLQNRHNGVLESPTGTGKTLSLLCSSLAWMKVEKERIQAELVKKTNEDADSHEEAMDKFVEAQLWDESEDDPDRDGSSISRPQIIYASRTHSQLAQAMNELKRTAYKDMKACILGSREQMCVHPDVKDLENNAAKTAACRVKVKSRSCMYQKNVERERNNPVFGHNPVIDLEDLVKLGDTHKFCPYYMAKDIQRRADIIFMPYNYLLDSRAWKSLNIQINANTAVILDEAHNVEKVCEDSASFEIKTSDITLCLDEITSVIRAISENYEMLVQNNMPPDFTPDELEELKRMLKKFETALNAVSITNNKEGVTFDGYYIFSLLDKAGITDANHNYISSLLERVGIYLASLNTFQRKAFALQMFEDLMRICFAKIGQDFKEKLRHCFRVHIQAVNDDKKNWYQPTWMPKATTSKGEVRILNYWCFNPGFGMDLLISKGVKCIILTSGTLAPLKPLITELELKVDVRLENPHIVKRDQVCVKILAKGPDGILLNSSYQNRSNPAYIKSLGMTICNLIRILPDGLLIFFPSYPIMQQCKEQWEMEGIWDSMQREKSIHVEPKQKQAFNDTMTEYYAAIKDPSSRGAVFMGVCRGKVSEGLDFIDANGRAVIITGLPFPPMKDPRVILKKEYLDKCRITNKEYSTGNDWYCLEATKAVNQAIGRVIRHATDYGAIILLDSRFDSPRIINQMSRWLRSHVKVNNYGEIIRELNKFFKYASEMYPVVERKSAKCGLIGLEDSQKENIPQSDVSGASSESANEVAARKKRGGAYYKRFINKRKRTHGDIVDLTSDPPTENDLADIKDYLLMVHGELGHKEYISFMEAFRKYNDDQDISVFLKIIESVFVAPNPDSIPILIGLRMFLLPKHREEFVIFLERYAAD